MSEEEDGIKHKKDNVRNHDTRLLQDLKSEHNQATTDIKQRLFDLEDHHKAHRDVLSEHTALLSAQSDHLIHIKNEIESIRSGFDHQTTKFDEHSKKLDTLSSKFTPTRRNPANTYTPFTKSQETRMSDIQTETYEPELQDWRALSWSSLIFGAIAALAISVMLHILGLGVTASSVDTNNTAKDAATMIGGVTGVWFLASTAVSLFIGGFIASALAHTFTGSRAAIYGIGVWALTTLVTMSVVVPALVNGAGNAITTAGTVVDKAGAVLGSATSGAIQAGQNVPQSTLESLQRSLVGVPNAQADQATVQDITRLLGQRFTQGEWNPQQRDQLVNDVAKIANISPDEARQRVADAQNTINSTIEQAQQKLRQAAEATRQAISAASYSTFLSMLVGLLAAFFGARYGELDEDQLPTFARIRLKSHASTYTK